MTYVIVVPGDSGFHLFMCPPDRPLRRVAVYTGLRDFWRYLPMSAMYKVIVIGHGLGRVFQQLVRDYYDLVIVPGRWFQHLPRGAHYRRAAWALRLARTHYAAPIQYHRRGHAYDGPR